MMNYALPLLYSLISLLCSSLLLASQLLVVLFLAGILVDVLLALSGFILQSLNLGRELLLLLTQLRESLLILTRLFLKSLQLKKCKAYLICKDRVKGQLFESSLCLHQEWSFCHHRISIYKTFLNQGKQGVAVVAGSLELFTDNASDPCPSFN
jgi:hypothetical protein